MQCRWVLCQNRFYELILISLLQGSTHIDFMAPHIALTDWLTLCISECCTHTCTSVYTLCMFVEMTLFLGE